jgi:hypothetical protein
MTKFRIDLAIVGSLLERQDNNEGWIQDFKLGWAQLKILRRAEGGAKIFGVFGVKNHDFTPKNLFFSNCGGRRENIWGILCEKSRFYANKSYFSNFRGGGVPPGSAPDNCYIK